ncbi:hypothetical protein SPRG_09555 [Saprolegnia parasitica CBS 223.65]|uniref:Polycystin cation channel PKD1/PKD2 domain-containing protein n=1 Tax=Saprolegnia parasitica (strain CBS 223.65) TaxID=695850 RepID=A0A067CED4_SAPPC|nr:hypothetical protein SPRG_09555 [Saprolegnia parasitica CBS 223.65]KDO24911.1 hypothetical protein SPRG_09555 [Saprolegnia parasitica CBS 223.65]|eukprot:XP_012204371.1 hypothetical protein SPRG_09555 [Saprolegnia parasitica CBS 223.65]
MKHPSDEQTLPSPFDHWSPDIESIPRLSEGDRAETISTTDARAALATRAELRMHFLNVPFPIVLFFAFVSVVLTHTPIYQVFFVNHGISIAISPLPADTAHRPGTLEFMNIRTAADFESWFEFTMLPEIFPAKGANNSALENATIGRIGSYNQVVGAVEVSVLNAPKAKCPSDGQLASHYGGCYDFESDFDITDGDVHTRNTRRQPWYTLYLPLQEPLPYTKYRAWQEHGSIGGYYINLGTRQIDIKITTYNGELDMFTYLRFALEFQAGGAIEPKYSVNSVPANPYAESPINLLPDVLVALLGIRLVVRRIVQLASRMKAQTAWVTAVDVIEWLSVASLVVYYIAWMRLFQRCFASDFEDQVAALRTFYDSVYALPVADQSEAMASSSQPSVSDFMDGFAPALSFLYMMSILTCLQLAVNVMSALHFHPTMSILSTTIMGSVRRLGTFLFLFLLVVVALATSGALLFGPKLEAFASLGAAMVTCINMIFNGYEYDHIKDIHPLAVVWYWLSQSIITLVLVNIMLAVIISAHEDVVHVDHGKRSFLQEMLWVLRDVLHTDCVCKGRHVLRLQERLAIDNGTRVWRAAEIAQAIGISDAQGARWVRTLKQFASVHTTASADTFEDATTPPLDEMAYRRRLEDRIKFIDAKLEVLVEYIQLHEHQRMLQHV